MDSQLSPTPEAASILLQQEVLGFVLAHLVAFRDPALKPYQGLPKENGDDDDDDNVAVQYEKRLHTKGGVEFDHCTTLGRGWIPAEVDDDTVQQ
jgi:hypothetical protein